MPNTRIDNTGRSDFQEFSRQELRNLIARGIETLGKFAVAAKVMEISSKVGEIISVGRDFLIPPIDFLQFFSFVKCHLSLCSFQSKSCVPGAAVRQVKPAARGVYMSEGGVNDVCVGQSKYQFVNTDAGQEARFTEQSVIGCAFEFQKAIQIRIVGRQPRQRAFAVPDVLGRDKTMCIILPQGCRPG